MNLIWRTLGRLLFAYRGKARAPFDVVHSRFRVLPTDIDIYGHLNNGRYLTIADLGRFDLLKQLGLWKPLAKRGWYPVVSNLTISYRKSLDLWTTFDLETRFVGVEGRSIYLEQRFVVAGEIYAQMFVRGRFLSRKGGHVDIDDVLALMNLTRDQVPVDQWLHDWAQDVALPSTKHPAPNTWS